MRGANDRNHEYLSICMGEKIAQTGPNIEKNKACTDLHLPPIPNLVLKLSAPLLV